MTKYQIEDTDYQMEESAKELAQAVVGHKIVKVEANVPIPTQSSSWRVEHAAAVLTLDNGKRVFLQETGDCCADTSLNDFLFSENLADHVITAVGTEDDYQIWHIMADMAEVLKLDVSWSEGSGYYTYGFEIQVFEPGQEENEWLRVASGA